MEYTTTRMTGESMVITPHEERRRLNNKEITPDVASLFLTAEQIPAKVEFSSRVTKDRWGTTWQESKRIVLYRHSVWVFLHELAHIVAFDSAHDGDFPIALHGLYLKWKEIES